MENSFKQIAEKLLERTLKAEDGIESKEIETVEKILNIKLPNQLRDLYLNVGNLPCFMNSFEIFAKPDELYFEKEKLIFLEENQSVCYWGIDATAENPEVFMFVPVEGETETAIYSENINLSEFLRILMYYQFAQGGCEYCSSIDEMQKINNLLEKNISNWEKVVDHNGLIIFWQNGMLLWYFTDRDGEIQAPLYLSSNSKSKINEMEKYGFNEL
jgi:hypothetical protein